MKILLGSISINYDLWLPYSSGCLISYAKYDGIADEVQFAEPLYKWLPDIDLEYRLAGIDILGLTCYTWNQEYNYHIAKLYKLINTNGIVIFGGPNIPLDNNMHEHFANTYPAVDCFFTGQGEKSFVEILKLRMQHCSTWPGCFGKGFSNQPFVFQNITSDFMPQPYLDGVFDSILSKELKIKASFETNRGCPFKCAFCDWGGTANGRVIKFAESKIEDTIDFIYQHAAISEIEILDANFGMHRRDLDTVNAMVAAKHKHNNNPNVSYSGLVKNGSPYLVDIINIIHNQLGAERRHLKLSFQTHSTTTLEVVLRDNIKNDKLLSMIGQLTDCGINISSEMIIALPGETAMSWLESQATDYNHGISFMRTYILSLVCNTKLYDADYRAIHNIKSKRILIPYGMKDIPKQQLIDNYDYTLTTHSAYEAGEIVYQCNSFDIVELKLMFRYFWYYHNFYNSRAFRLTMKLLVDNGIGIVQQVLDFYHNLDLNTVIGQLISRTDAIVEKIYGDEPCTILDNYASYRFYSGSLRTVDLYNMLVNKHVVATQLIDQLVKQYSHIEYIHETVMQDVGNWIDITDTGAVSKLFGMGSSITYG
jgi:radical SAM superfamily enzyme YgiQ (UPF0313 family)